MGSNVCQLRINCLPAPNAPFHKCMLCDHRWDSFKHFSFTMSRMLSLPDTEHWRDPEENVYPTISSPGRYSVGLCPIHMWRPDHVVPHQPYSLRKTYFLSETHSKGNPQQCRKGIASVCLGASCLDLLQSHHRVGSGGPKPSDIQS